MVQLTPQYLGGLCAGFGSGLLVASWLNWGWHPPFVILAFLMIGVGASAARAAQRTVHNPVEGTAEPPHSPSDSSKGTR